MGKILTFLLLLLLVLSQTENLVSEDAQQNTQSSSEPSITSQPTQNEQLPAVQNPQETPAQPSSAQDNALLTQSQEQQSSTDYPCIIVGAGISGIAASAVLSEQGIRHLLLEAKENIGGRIAPGTFAGQTIDLGANFIHDPQSNLLNEVASQLGIGQILADFHLQAPFYPNNSLLDSQTQLSADALYQTFKSYVEEQKAQLETDVSLDSLFNSFATSQLVSGAIYDRLYQDVQVEASENGADLSEMSSFEFEGGNKVTVSSDYVPAGGWAHFLKTIYDSWCTPELKLSEIVTSIDYSGNKVIVSTSKGNQYTTNHLLYSPSLGTLKANSVSFTPSLPQDKLNAINQIGFGRFQKLYVLFKEKFWPDDKRILHFIGQGQAAPYVEAWTVSNDLGLNLVVFFMTGAYVSKIASWEDSSIAADLASFLTPYVGKTPQIEQIFMTRWVNDPLTWGAYSFEKVGTTKDHFSTLRAPITLNNNVIHLIGEHTSPQDFSYAQGAYEAGQSAAKEVVSSLPKS